MISKNQIKFVKQLEMKKYRQREGLFVAEGPKVVGDLLAAGFEPHAIYATEEWAKSSTLNPQLSTLNSQPSSLNSQLSSLNSQLSSLNSHPSSLISQLSTLNSHPSSLNPQLSTLNSQLSTLTPDELRKLSFLQHPQQVLAVFSIRNRSNEAPSGAVGGASLTLALDGIQDPGNLGTIIRIADWFGIDSIVCSLDTADAWSPKVVQATMGSIARVAISYTDLKEYLSHTTLPVCGTLLDGDNIYTQELPQEAIIVMGNEGNGISHDIRQLVTHRLLIPQYRPGAESLNVAIATAITCAEFRRRTATK